MVSVTNNPFMLCVVWVECRGGLSFCNLKKVDSLQEANPLQLFTTVIYKCS
jgi:hypothetical protein